MASSWWVNFRDNIESKFEALATWWEGTTLGQAVDSDAKLAIAELEKLGEINAKQAGLVIGEAALTGWATGGAAGAFAAGVAAAPEAFKAAEANISNTTVHTLVTTVVNQLETQQVKDAATPNTDPTPPS